MITALLIFLCAVIGVLVAMLAAAYHKSDEFAHNIVNLKRDVQLLSEMLREAQKNDHRDKKTGKYKKGT